MPKQKLSKNKCFIVCSQGNPLVTQYQHTKSLPGSPGTIAVSNLKIESGCDTGPVTPFTHRLCHNCKSNSVDAILSCGSFTLNRNCSMLECLFVL